MNNEKDKTVNLAARVMAEKRWKNKTVEEREQVKRAARLPRSAKRCFCGAHSMWRAANRRFDCCRKAGVIVLNPNAAAAQGHEQQPAGEQNHAAAD